MRTLLLSGILALSLLAVGGVRGDDAAPTAGPPMKIMPAPAQVTIDGDLTEWNKDGKLGPATFDPDSIDDFSATCYAMYDANYLYLAAVIVEPHPPYNTYPVKGVGAWNGDAVAIRMSSNPALKWPLEGSRDTLKDAPDLFTADFWWNEGKKRTYWDAYHGMGGPRIPDEEWGDTQVAVKLAADGKGYTEEVRVPWKTINLNYHPQTGDRIAFTWEIEISSANPAEPARVFTIFVNGGGTWAFTTASMWGQAVFQ